MNGFMWIHYTSNKIGISALWVDAQPVGPLKPL